MTFTPSWSITCSSLNLTAFKAAIVSGMAERNHNLFACWMILVSAVSGEWAWYIQQKRFWISRDLQLPELKLERSALLLGLGTETALTVHWKVIFKFWKISIDWHSDIGLLKYSGPWVEGKGRLCHSYTSPNSTSHAHVTMTKEGWPWLLKNVTS